MTQVENAGLFADVDKATLDQVPAEYRPSTGKWTGIAARSTVLVYDKRKVQANQLPASMLDLAKPEWKGRWAASPSGADFQAIVSALLELKGEAATNEWLTAMKTNAKVYKGNSTAMKAVNSGEVETALIYHYYYYGDQAKTGENSANVGTHYFKHQDPGAFVVGLRWRGAQVVEERRGRAVAAEVHHRQGRPGGAAEGHVLRVCHRLGRALQPGARAPQGPPGPEGRPRQAQLRHGHRSDDPGRSAVVLR